MEVEIWVENDLTWTERAEWRMIQIIRKEAAKERRGRIGHEGKKDMKGNVGCGMRKGRI